MIELPTDPDERTRVGCTLMGLVFMAGVIIATVLGSLLRRWLP